MIHPPTSEGEGPHKHQTFTYETYESARKGGHQKYNHSLLKQNQ